MEEIGILDEYTWIINLGTMIPFDSDHYKLIEEDIDHKYIMDMTTGQIMLIVYAHYEVDESINRSDEYLFVTETF